MNKLADLENVIFQEEKRLKLTVDIFYALCRKKLLTGYLPTRILGEPDLEYEQLSSMTHLDFNFESISGKFEKKSVAGKKCNRVFYNILKVVNRIHTPNRSPLLVLEI